MQILLILLLILVMILILMIFFLLKKISGNKNETEVLEATNNLITNISSLNNNLFQNISSNMSTLNEQVIKNVSNMDQKMENRLIDDFSKTNDLFLGFSKNISTMNNQLIGNVNLIDEKMENRMKEEFNKTNKLFTDLSTKMTKIDSAQQNIEKLSENLMNLQKLLFDKKQRGIFGEIQLYQILENTFGIDNKGKLYDVQYKMGDNKIVDAAIFNENSIIPIDSKFPLENYMKIENNGDEASKLFRENMKKHISDISEKYVIKGVSEQAFLFLPAESIYTYLISNEYQLLDLAYKKKVYIVSPTTLLATLTTIQSLLLEKQRIKNIKEVYFELLKLSDEFERYNKRWNDISNTISKLSKNVNDYEITNNKIINSFNKIKNVDIEESDIK